MHSCPETVTLISSVSAMLNPGVLCVVEDQFVKHPPIALTVPPTLFLSSQLVAQSESATPIALNSLGF